MSFHGAGDLNPCKVHRVREAGLPVPKMIPPMPQIKRRIGVVNCKNCGAPVQPSEKVCSYCKGEPA